MNAALFGMDGFSVLAVAEAGGELEVLVETTAELVGFPGCGAVARAKDRRPSWVRTCRWRAGGGGVLVETHLVLPARAVRDQDLDRDS